MTAFILAFVLTQGVQRLGAIRLHSVTSYAHGVFPSGNQTRESTRARLLQALVRHARPLALAGRLFLQQVFLPPLVACWAVLQGWGGAEVAPISRSLAPMMGGGGGRGHRFSAAVALAVHLRTRRLKRRPQPSARASTSDS